MPAWRMASRTLKVPSALISKSSRGAVTEVVTATCAARCSILIGIAMFAEQRRPDRRPCPDVQLDEFQGALRRSHSRFLWTPSRDRLSTTTTWCPRRKYRLAALEPMNPAPPVMIVFMNFAPCVYSFNYIGRKLP